MPRTVRSWRSTRPLSAPLLLGVWLVLVAASATGQVIRDGSIGDAPAGVVPDTGPPGSVCDYCILEDLGELRDSNLFHSFSQFDVGNGENATFFGNEAISNVIARVPGGNRSEIYGTIAFDGMSSADLYLLNPAGVLFGDGATLDLPAAFYVSTADSLRFANDPALSFVVDAPNPVLSGAEPSAFGFLGGTTGTVEFRVGRIFDVADGATLGVVAGDVIVADGTTLRSRGGTVGLAAAGEAATVIPLDLETFDAGGESDRLGTIRVSGGSIVSGRREQSSLASNGRVIMRGGELRFSENSIIAAGGDGMKVAVDLQAQSEIDLDGAWIVDDGGDVRGETGVHMRAPEISVHDGGGVLATTMVRLTADIRLDAEHVEVSDGAQIAASTYSDEAGSGISVTADTISLSRTSASAIPGRITTSSGSTGEGQAGDITITTGSLAMTDGGQIGSASFNGHGSGDVVIVATGAITASGRSNTDGPSGISSRAMGEVAAVPGHTAGSIDIQARTLDLSDGALISARTEGEVDAGHVLITADERITLRGSSTGTSEISARGHNGAGGDVTIEAPLVQLLDGGRISASTTGTGDAGSVVLRELGRLEIAGSARVTGTREVSGVFAETTRPIDGGDSGSISIDASHSVNILDGGMLSTVSAGEGNAGEIWVSAETSIRVGKDAVIQSDSQASGRAGDITLEAGKLVAIDGGQLRSRAASAEGGDITIQGDLRSNAEVEITNGAQLSTQAFGAGDAGSVDIRRVNKVLGVDSVISTESAQSSGGEVSIAAAEKVELVRSRIITDVASGSASGGNVWIDPSFVILNSSEISARADAGQGGNITIVAGNYFESADSLLDPSSSGGGIDGDINIRAPDNELGSELAQLTDEFLDASELLKVPCAAALAEDQSSFIIRDREALPVEPDGYLPMVLPWPEQELEDSSAEQDLSFWSLAAADHPDTGCPPRRTPPSSLKP